jgi:hypothetical protein
MKKNLISPLILLSLLFLQIKSQDSELKCEDSDEYFLALDTLEITPINQ